jgi:hypothetical protein
MCLLQDTGNGIQARLHVLLLNTLLLATEYAGLRIDYIPHQYLNVTAHTDDLDYSMVANKRPSRNPCASMFFSLLRKGQLRK